MIDLKPPKHRNTAFAPIPMLEVLVLLLLALAAAHP